MSSKFSISDVRVTTRLQHGSKIVILNDEDHLLRRIGQIEVRRLGAGERTPFTYRDEADEVWYVLEGRARITLVDQRVESPSKGEQLEIELSDADGKAVLVPFGVAYSLAGQTEAVAIRVATHSDGTHAKDSESPYAK